MLEKTLRKGPEGVLRIFNTLSGQLEDFHPLQDNLVRMYTCGPTVYDYAHIGNFRTFIFEDVLKRYLRFKGYRVNHVMNITDVDDKTIRNSGATEPKQLREYTDRFTAAFRDDCERLRMDRPDLEVHATDHIDDMVAMIERLRAKGYTYEREGSVYYKIANFKDYGKLSKLDLQGIKAGARVDVDEYEKQDARDFALWKAKKNGEPSWLSTLGPGRPGWHIECSAMSCEYLGFDFDIHGGGADLQFPHHENEIAQSICANKNSHYAKYWIHNGFLTVNGEKMSKSLKNFITVRDLLNKKIPGIVIRYLLLSSHYRKPLDFNDKALLDAEKSIEKFYSVINNKTHQSSENHFLNDIINALSDDLNTPVALAILHDLTKSIKTKPELTADLISCLDFLGLYDDSYLIAKNSADENIDETYILEQIELRKKAKTEKNWKLADGIRNELASIGIILEDKPGGQTGWVKK